MKRENYYILLEIDPSVRDEVSINDAIGNKAGQWSRDRNHPRKGTMAQKYLGMLPDIKRILLNPATREEEADDALKIILDEKAKSESKLIMAAKGLVKNGTIKEDDLITLAKKINFTEDEVERILKVRVLRTPKGDGIEMLDESLMMSIRSDLNVVGKKNLFEFLGLFPSSSCTDLVNEAIEMYNKYSKNSNKTAEVTATVSLSNLCIQRLKDEASIDKYFKSLHYEYFGDIKEMIDIWSSKGSIDAADYQELVSMSEEREIPPERAVFFIYNYCSKKGLEIDMNVPVTPVPVTAPTPAPAPTSSPSSPTSTSIPTPSTDSNSFLKIAGIIIVLIIGCYVAYKVVGSGNKAPSTVFVPPATQTEQISKSNTQTKENVVAQPEETQPSQTILVQSASIDRSSLNLNLDNNRTGTLNATVLPSNATDRNVEWSTNNASVATVNNGIVTAVNAGNAVIAVRSVDGSNRTAQCTVTVSSHICENCTINYSFGNYVGRTVNGIPDGRGTLKYTCRIQIARHGSTTQYAENGDVLTGSWANGDINTGYLQDSNGSQKASILAGKRPSAYNLKNDRCE